MKVSQTLKPKHVQVAAMVNNAINNAIKTHV